MSAARALRLSTICAPVLFPRWRVRPPWLVAFPPTSPTYVAQRRDFSSSYVYTPPEHAARRHPLLPLFVVFVFPVISRYIVARNRRAYILADVMRAMRDATCLLNDDAARGQTIGEEGQNELPSRGGRQREVWKSYFHNILNCFRIGEMRAQTLGKVERECREEEILERWANDFHRSILADCSVTPPKTQRFFAI